MATAALIAASAATKQIDELKLLGVGACTHRQGGVQVKPACERRQATKQNLFGFGQQSV